MKVLVTAASRHEATREIAAAIGRTLAQSGLDVEVRRAEDVAGIAEFDAVVLGSAVYIGKWLGPARDVAERHAPELRERPTWLFSSGPVGEPLRPTADEAVRIDDLVKLTHAREHRLLAGRIDRSRLGFAERAIVRAVRVAEGDYRDWDEIERWAREIAATLTERPVGAGVIVSPVSA
jgi:menaquinone-dependent protoporphyrinogen oxidase